MNTPCSTPDPDDPILAEFVLARESRGGAAVEEYVHRYPHLAERIRALVQMHDAITDAGDSLDPPVPECLGDFRVVRRLAVGGQGEVYEAVQEHLGRRVAVKIIRRGRASEGACNRFLREQQVLARLQQTHILPIHTAGEEGPLQFFAMPYIEGAALSHVLEAVRRLGATDAGGRTPTLAELACRVAAGDDEPARDVLGTTVSRSETPPTGAPPRPPAGVPGVPDRPHLSRAYFRSVAGVMADVAEAVEYAHAAGILHRDLKPSNLMVDRAGQCWIIDFGLAAYVREADRSAGTAGAIPAEPEAASGVLGTPEYMAPEQLAGKADVRSDVWGLGVTLYELLTLGRAFEAPTAAELCAKIQSQEPPRARERVSNVPPDLEAVCRKALRKGAGQRYPTAAAFAEDLRRWLRHEPTTARPARVLRRVWLWARCNTGWAAALVLVLLASVGLVWAAFGTQRTKAAAERERALDEQGEREAQREVFIQKVYRVRLGPHSADWAKDAWGHARAAARLRASDELRDLASTLLRGIDIYTERSFRGFEGTSLVFDPTGRRVAVAGGVKDQARYWDVGIGEPVLSGQRGTGPVAFRDGVPVQIVARDATTLVLWDMARRRALKELKAPGAVHLEPSRAVLTPDAAFLAAAVTMPAGKAAKVRESIAVWEVESGKRLASVDRAAFALALSPDGKLLAAGDGGGEINVWSLPDAKLRATLWSDAGAIRCLAFARDATGGTGGRAAFAGLAGWLLAAGRVGGVVVWDLSAGVPRSYCRDSGFDVQAVAFRADGTVLASTNASEVKLWDVATGQRLLRMSLPSYHFGLAFTPDGRRLVVSTVPVYGHGSKVPIYGPGGLALLRVEDGRGIQTLRGITGRVVQVRFSPDGKLLAGVATNWQVAIWQRATGNLLHVLNVPPGILADNAALAFSADGKQLAFSSGAEVTLWDVATGRRRASWKLPQGVGDRLAFHPDGKLLSFRVEGGVWKFRDLSGAEPTKPFAEKKDFRGGFVDVVATPGGEYVAVEGFTRPGRRGRVVKVFDGPTGKEVWSRSTSGDYPSGQLTMDPAGKLLAFAPAPKEPFVVVEVPSGKFRRTLKGHLAALSPGAQFWLGSGDPYDGFTVRRASDGAALMRPGLNVPGCARPEFSPDGRHVAWGNDDGTAFVCDIEDMQRRLAGIGLGW